MGTVFSSRAESENEIADGFQSRPLSETEAKQTQNVSEKERTYDVQTELTRC